VLLLIPCFWQSRIQAGDLSSHLYNVWLAQLIERGEAPGLRLVGQSSNVLFDLMLSTLVRWCGAGAAQRIAVSCSVLVFFWGSFAFVWSWSRRREPPWVMLPSLAMLAYGWVFHMGLFNFYLSLGLCLAAMALARRWKWPWIATGAGLLLLAYPAHSMPVLWAMSVLALERTERALAPRRRPGLMIGLLAALAFTGLLLAKLFVTGRGVKQFLAVTGVDQLWTFSQLYLAVALALFAAWAACFLQVWRTRGTARTLLDVRTQICFISAMALILLPDGVLLPGYRAGLDFIAERMSLASAVLFCGVLASARVPRMLTALMAVIAIVFFGMTYRDERALNRLETDMEQAVAQLPPSRRVVSGLANPEQRMRARTHLIDRVCFGRCYSYANYEPGSAAFRVRADGPNPIVAWTYADSWEMQTGVYVVRPRDLPLYRIAWCDSAEDRLCVAPMNAGDHTLFRLDPHAVETAVNEGHRNQQENHAEYRAESGALLIVQRYRQFYSQQPE